jgi:uncharacterized radical SAM superfamily Fe-S cluster-containing enzyme
METKYPKGIFIDKPRDGAPEFVRARLSIKAEDAVAWIKEVVNEKGYVNVDILNGDKGLYLKHNDWKPEEKKEEEIDPSSVPF